MLLTLLLAMQYGEVDVVQMIGQLDLVLGTQLALRLPDIDPTVSPCLYFPRTRLLSAPVVALLLPARAPACAPACAPAACLPTFD